MVEGRDREYEFNKIKRLQVRFPIGFGKYPTPTFPFLLSIIVWPQFLVILMGNLLKHT